MKLQAVARGHEAEMKIEQFEDIQAWQLARQLARSVYRLTRRSPFFRDFALKDQIQRAAGSAMHNIAEGFDADSNTEFARFLRYSQRSCTEIQSQHYLALDEQYIDEEEFDEVYRLAARTRAAARGFANYLARNPRIPGPKTP